MKNIHILPTDKPSRITKNNLGKFIKLNGLQYQEVNENQHIYITSDEEIKEGDWCYNSINNTVYKKELNKLSFAYEYKIILTTDQDLIKDGVQDIDDEFLEWFVKNPGCKFVEVKFETLWLNKRFGGSWQPFPDETATVKKKNYKIIIPKEELNPTTQVVREAMRIVSKDVRLPKVVREGLVKEEPKQETLEEAAEDYGNSIGNKDGTAQFDFIKGAKWQQERMYKNMEELILLLKHTTEYEVLENFRNKVSKFETLCGSK